MAAVMIGGYLDCVTGFDVKHSLGEEPLVAGYNDIVDYV